MGLFDRFRKKPVADTPVNIFWVRSPKGAYYNFLNLDPEEKGLMGVSAVFIIWHAGLRPEWLYVGHSDDLGATFDELREHDEIREYDSRGGLYATWSEVKPEYQPGIVKYLMQVLKPVIEPPEPEPEIDDDGNVVEPPPEPDVDPIAVFPPGMAPPPAPAQAP